MKGHGMTEVDTFSFQERETGGEAVAIVQRARGEVAVTLSLRVGGDLQVVMGTSDARRLVASVQRAIDGADEALDAQG